MSRLLIIYSTTDGHTRDICLTLKTTIEENEHRVQVKAIGEVSDYDLKQFDKIVLGASIRYGKHAESVYRFIEQNSTLLASKPNAFFSVNAVARKPHKRQIETNPYVKKFLSQIDWQPQTVEIFAGKINYPIYSFWDRQLIRLIMWMTGGPTDPQAVVEFTDWEQVRAFARHLSQSD